MFSRRYAKMAGKASTAPPVQGGLVDFGSGGEKQPIFVNRVEMPPAPPQTLHTPDAKVLESKSGGPTPIGKRQLDQGQTETSQFPNLTG